MINGQWEIGLGKEEGKWTKKQGNRRNGKKEGNIENKGKKARKTKDREGNKKEGKGDKGERGKDTARVSLTGFPFPHVSATARV